MGGTREGGSIKTPLILTIKVIGTLSEEAALYFLPSLLRRGQVLREIISSSRSK